jgi:hypothetical protein
VLPIITVTGLVGSHANDERVITDAIRATKNFFIDTPNINNEQKYLCHLAKIYLF